MELARVYDEMGCEEEAARAYLRVMRMGGRHTAQALFHLALSSAQPPISGARPLISSALR